jgi:hypothetical protein
MFKTTTVLLIPPVVVLRTLQIGLNSALIVVDTLLEHYIKIVKKGIKNG